MAELVLKRTFAAPLVRVFSYVTQTRHLMEWWGPEGMFIPDGTLDFSQIGSWYSVMQNKDGDRYKVSGQVVFVDPPNAVEFTWAWHDDSDARGVETTVRFSLAENAIGGTDFTLKHTGFADEDAMGNHKAGWTSSLRKLAAQFGDT